MDLRSWAKNLEILVVEPSYEAFLRSDKSLSSAKARAACLLSWHLTLFQNFQASMFADLNSLLRETPTMVLMPTTNARIIA